MYFSLMENIALVSCRYHIAVFCLLELNSPTSYLVKLVDNVIFDL